MTELIPLRSIRDLAAATRGRRLSLRFSQAELARRAAVSRKWVSEFEAGKASAELGLVLRVLEALDLQLGLLNTDEGTTERRRAGGSVDLDDLLASLRGRERRTGEEDE